MHLSGSGWTCPGQQDYVDRQADRLTEKEVGGGSLESFRRASVLTQLCIK